MAILEVENLKTHYYIGDKPVYAVDDVSFTIDKNETLGLAGESGCGKTTTAYSILRILPANGCERFAGRRHQSCFNMQ
jgi:peptide/nickel transport system ATP-binding protein